MRLKFRLAFYFFYFLFFIIVFKDSSHVSERDVNNFFLFFFFWTTIETEAYIAFRFLSCEEFSEIASGVMRY